MQKEWNKLLLFAIAVGFKSVIKMLEDLHPQVHKVGEGDFADQYSAAVKAYKKELGLG